MENMDLMRKVFKPGTKIEILPDRRGRLDEDESETKYYHSKISDLREDGSVEIYMPIERGKLMLMSVGKEADFLCYSSSGIYRCRVVVTERYKHDGLYFLLLEPTGELRRNQRREFYRYQCTVPMQSRKMDEEEERWLMQRGQLLIIDENFLDESVITDISGGGIRFSGKLKYEEGDIVYCKFSFGQEYEECIRVLESSEIPERTGEYRHRAKFVAMKNKEREEIIKYIFAMERMRKKFNNYEYDM